MSPNRPAIIYIRIGERSAHTWFVLHELLGYPGVRIYDGSWTDGQAASSAAARPAGHQRHRVPDPTSSPFTNPSIKCNASQANSAAPHRTNPVRTRLTQASDFFDIDLTIQHPGVITLLNGVIRR